MHSYTGDLLMTFDKAQFDKALEEYLLDEANSKEVTITVTLFHLKPYPQEPEQTFRLRVVRSLVWVGMEPGHTMYSAGQAIRGYMSIQ